MKMNEIRVLLEAQPFHAFTIRIGETRQLEVPHPEFLALSPAGDIAIVFRREGGIQRRRRRTRDGPGSQTSFQEVPVCGVRR